jgi:hypothetical protein
MFPVSLDCPFSIATLVFVGDVVIQCLMAKRYQRGNHNQYIEEQQTTQWPKEKGQTTIYKTYL